MSHFVLLVAMTPPPADVSIEDKLANMLAPYDENKEVPEYRDYEDGPAEAFWLYTSVKRTAAEVAAGDRSSVKPYRPDEIGFSSAFDTKRTEEQQWVDLQEEAAAFEKFSNPPTWPEVIEYSNNRWYPEGERDDNRGSYMRYDATEDRAYTWSTYNPDSKWDWYQIGGRWSDYFPVKDSITSAEYYDHMIQGRRAYGMGVGKGRTHVDGGPVGLLDLNRRRDEKGAEAAERYDAYQALVQDLPEALPFRLFSEDAQGRVALTDNKQEISDIWDKAREAYNGQPRVRVARESDMFKWDFSCLVVEFSVNRESYIQTARNAAVPGYALLTPKGEWVAPGRMGMFGMSSASDEDTASFKTKANEYIEGLDPNTLLIAVDCHI